MSGAPVYQPGAPAIGAVGERVWAVAAEVAAERLRQITEEGYTPASDDAYVDRELARAAGAYALNAAGQDSGSLFFPWPGHTWKPGDPRRDLIKAAATCMAEVERLDRVAAQEVSS